MDMGKRDGGGKVARENAGPKTQKNFQILTARLPRVKERTKKEGG